MTTAPALIPELDDIVRRGDPKRRAEAARRLGELFLQGAASFRPDHIDLFDGVLTSLVPACRACRAGRSRRTARAARQRAAASGRAARPRRRGRDRGAAAAPIAGD
ncbi:hypothetical protein ACVIHH_006516 [Bradyrhizobium sp. USDA 4518]